MARVNTFSFDRRIVIQRANIVQDLDTGQKIKTFSDLVTVSASLVDSSAKEGEKDGQIIATQKTIFSIRWRESLKNTDRVNYNNQVYDIEAIHRIGRKKYMNLICLLRDNQ